MSRREFTKQVYNEIVKRAFHLKLGFICEGCGLVLGKKTWHVDHTIADAFHIDKSTKLTADDGKLLGVDCCHAQKTKDDVKRIAKSKRVESKYLGIKKQSSSLSNPRFKKCMNGDVVDRRTGEVVR
jgi:hypothetical protein